MGERERSEMLDCVLLLKYQWTRSLGQGRFELCTSNINTWPNRTQSQYIVRKYTVFEFMVSIQTLSDRFGILSDPNNFG